MSRRSRKSDIPEIKVNIDDDDDDNMDQPTSLRKSSKKGSKKGLWLERWLKSYKPKFKYMFVDEPTEYAAAASPIAASQIASSPIAASPIAAAPASSSMAAAAVAAAAPASSSMAAAAVAAAAAPADRPAKLRKTYPSFISPLPYEFEKYFLPQEYMQIPSSAQIAALQAVSGSLPEQIAYAQTSINDMNTIAYGLGLDLELRPTEEEIVAKLRTDAAYWARTGDIDFTQLEGIKEWFEGKIDSGIMSCGLRGSQVIYLIIDFQNVFGCLQDFVGKLNKDGDFYNYDDYRKCMMELAHILCSKVLDLYEEHNAPIGIVLCAQNHNLYYNPDFYNLIKELNSCSARTGYRDGIIVIPTHSRSEFDDFMVAVAGEILNKKKTLQQEPYYLFTSDQLRDLQGINAQLAHRLSVDIYLLSYYRINLSDTTPGGIRKYKAYLKTTGYLLYRNRLLNSGKFWKATPYPLTPPHPPPPPISSVTRTITKRRGGGTIKYKKSLLNKRTRKIYKKNYSQKMKTYSKNKKKKTLRRRRRL
jgi:hypothetical protein